jgi:hypothetical protein
MQFHVTQQYGRGPEQRIGQFKLIIEAHKFIKDKLLLDVKMKVNTTYRLYEWDDLIDEQTSTSAVWQKMAEEEQSGTSASGPGAGSTFSPTPFPTAPRPPGMPASAFKREDDKDNQDKDK